MFNIVKRMQQDRDISNNINRNVPEAKTIEDKPFFGAHIDMTLDSTDHIWLKCSVCKEEPKIKMRGNETVASDSRNNIPKKILVKCSCYPHYKAWRKIYVAKNN